MRARSSRLMASERARRKLVERNQARLYSGMGAFATWLNHMKSESSEGPASCTSCGEVEFLFRHWSSVSLLNQRLLMVRGLNSRTNYLKLFTSTHPRDRRNHATFHFVPAGLLS